MELTVSFRHQDADIEAADFLVCWVCAVAIMWLLSTRFFSNYHYHDQGIAVPAPPRKRRRKGGFGVSLHAPNYECAIPIGRTLRAVGDCKTAPPEDVHCPPTVSRKPATVVVTVLRGPIYLKANYAKFVRNLSQTPWFVTFVCLVVVVFKLYKSVCLWPWRHWWIIMMTGC